MIEIIISPQKFRKRVNVYTFELFLVFEGHAEIRKNESVLRRCENHVIETGRKLVSLFIKSELGAILSEKRVHFLEGMLKLQVSVFRRNSRFNNQAIDFIYRNHDFHLLSDTVSDNLFSHQHDSFSRIDYKEYGIG